MNTPYKSLTLKFLVNALFLLGENVKNKIQIELTIKILLFEERKGSLHNSTYFNVIIVLFIIIVHNVSSSMAHVTY